MERAYIGEPERTMYLNPSETRRDYIIDMFEKTQSFHIPVVRDKYLLGIVCLFDVIRFPSEEINLMDILQTNCYVAGKQIGIFSFKLKGQSIVPFVDEEGKYVNFMNRITSKCYLPSKEYLRLLDPSVSAPIPSGDGAELLNEPFDALFESNEDIVFVTVKKGKTIAVNNNAVLLRNIKSIENLENIDDLEMLDINKPIFQQLPARVFQNVQSRKELTLYRVGEDVGNDIIGLRQELAEMELLAKTYKTQLSNIDSGLTDGNTIVFQSSKGKMLSKSIVNIARFDSTVLLLGESGVGKSMFASFIHRNSSRHNEAFITIDCASLPATLLESELFGYEAGSFTGAKKGGKIGLVELADKGTLFLDEISELPLELQGKLLRLIQEKCFYRVGGEQPIFVDIRIIAATNRNLQEMVNEKTFRQDLYYRINVIPIVIPPLRERREDIIPLIDTFLYRLNQKYAMEKTLHPATYRRMIAFDWPGNVRELENALEYMFVTSEQNVIYQESFTYAPKQQVTVSSDSDNYDFDMPLDMTLKDAVEQFEKSYLKNMLQQYSKVSELSKILNVDRSTITRKLTKYGLSE